jgi:DNA polymerase-3 subunit gamma/tau
LFENLIAQESIRKQLSSAVMQNKLPHSLLFNGEDYSGKLSAALELARTVSCEKGSAAWDCNCRSCRDHRVLNNPDLLLLGRRYFLEEIKASAELLNRSRATFAVYMFIRNIRKLLKRFEPVIWEGQEKKLNKFSGALANANEAIEKLDPEKPLMPEEDLKAFLDDLIHQVRTLIPAVPAGVPIDQIRNISRWAHRTSNGRAKVIVLERADAIKDGAANALLKILEEPPAHVTFILTTDRKGSLIQTIRSRVRPYDFTPRSDADSALVLERLFRYEKADMSLYHFFQSWSDTDYGFISSHIRIFLDNCFSGGSIRELEDLFQYFDKNREKDELKRFLRMLSDEIRLRFREDPELISTVEGQALVSLLLGKINRCASNSSVYNQSSLFLLESLFYDIREQYEAFCN